MDRPEFTMEDIVTLVNSCDNEFIIHVEFGEEETHEQSEESVFLIVEVFLCYITYPGRWLCWSRALRSSIAAVWATAAALLPLLPVS